MQITTERFEEFAILRLQGEFDSYPCPRFGEEVESLARTGVVRVVLDLRKVRFINSTALGAVLEASKRLSAAHGRLVIARPSRFCREIIHKIGLERVIGVFDSDREAERALVEDEAEPPADVDTTSTVQGTADGLDDEAGVLFTPRDPRRVRLFIPAHRRLGRTNPVHRHVFGSRWQGVGFVREVLGEGLRFTWSGGRAGLTPFEMGRFLAPGTELEVKFRLPLFRKGYHPAVVTVTEVQELADGIEVAVGFTEITAETLGSVRQYTADMELLRGALGAGETDGSTRQSA